MPPRHWLSRRPAPARGQPRIPTLPSHAAGSVESRSLRLGVVVNPNNPTGAFLARDFWLELLPELPAGIRIWIDECYIDYVDANQSLEAVAATNRKLVVCKSLSKCLALSGLRAGYLTLVPELASELRRLAPPWNLGTLTQLGLSAALDETDYYAARYADTHRNRHWLAQKLGELGFRVIGGSANYFLAQLPDTISDKAFFLKSCEQKQLFVRDTFPTSPELGPRMLRFAVKDEFTNRRIVAIIQEVIGPCELSTPKQS